MIIQIAHQSPVPIYEQLFAEIEQMIISGDLEENDSLPSIRQLASQLDVAVNTVARAYQELERKVQERTDELNEKNNRLVQAERLAAFGKMANRVAHELRNPLTVVGGFARRIWEKTPDKDPNKKYLKVIVGEVMAMENKVTEITKSENER